MTALMAIGAAGCAAQVNFVAPGSQQRLSQSWENAKSTYMWGNITLAAVNATDATAWPLFSAPPNARIYVATPEGAAGELRLKNFGNTSVLVVLTSPEKTGTLVLEANRMARLDASAWQQSVSKFKELNGPVSVALYGYSHFKASAEGSNQMIPVGKPFAEAVLEFDTLSNLKARQIAWPKGARPAGAGDAPLKIRPF